jgi:hypothetical protein
VDVLVDSVFRGLFGVMDPLGMILRTLMALLADALAKLITGAYGQLFELTTVDFDIESVSNIWRITTGLSAGLATVLLVVASFRSMLAQSNSYLLAALPGVVVAVLGPQALAVFLPFLAAALTDLAQVIVASATPDLAQSMRLLAGVGSNPIYEGLGLLAPLIAATMLFGLIAVFVVLLFCMAGAVVLFVMSPFAFAGLVMAPTRPWFTTWARMMFAVLFAKVPIAIMLALAVSLFANSRYAGMTQAFVNAAAGLVLGIGALIAPMLAFSLFGFMSAVLARPASPAAGVARTAGTAFYATQAGRSAVNGVRAAAHRVTSSPTTANSTSTPAPAPAPAPVEPSADERAGGASVTMPPSPGSSTAVVPAPVPPPTPGPAGGSGGPMGRPTPTPGPGPAPVATAASGGSAGTAATSGAAGGVAAAAGPAGVVVVGTEAARAAASTIRDVSTRTASSLAQPAASGTEPPGRRQPTNPGGEGSIRPASERRID